MNAEPANSHKKFMRKRVYIAYDAANDRLFVTGKLWPKLFQIELVPAAAYLPLVGRQ